MGKLPAMWVLGVVLAALAGCVTMPENRPASLSAANAPAWSLNSAQREMVVAVSPVRRTIQVLGSSGMVLGAGIDAIVNAKYRDAVREALTGYDPGTVFEERLSARLHEAGPAKLDQVAALQSMAGFSSLREAADARYAALAKRGYDAVLDLNMEYGLFGYEGLLVAKLQGRLTLLPEKHALWENALVVSTEPVLASDRLSDPTKRLGPDLSSPRFTVAEGAIERWTGDGGQAIRTRFEAAVDGVVSALLVDLGLAEEAPGEYYLAKLAMNRKRFEEADRRFQKALQLDPALLDAWNGRAVNLAHNKQLDDAIALATQLTEKHPDCGAAWFNLAWWYALDKREPGRALPCYEKALGLGIPRDPKLDKALGKT